MDSTPTLLTLDQWTFVAHWCQQTGAQLTCGLAILQVDPFRLAPVFLGWLL